MLLGESTPLNKERGEQGSKAHTCAGFKARAKGPPGNHGWDNAR